MDTTYSIEGFTPENIRHNVLPRAFLLRSLETRMGLRLRRAQQLVARAYATEETERVFAWMGALSITWTLVENMLKLYETIAEQIDTRYEGKRRGLDSRFLREREGDERVEFHRRIWLFAMFDYVPDSAFVAIGADPTAGRTIIGRLIDRSILYLAESEERMRSFYRKYKAVVNAHKHGRALFAFVPQLKSMMATGVTRGTLVASSDAVTAMVTDKPDSGLPTMFITVTADDELIRDIEDVLAPLHSQLTKFDDFFAAFTDAAMQFLAFLEQSPDARQPTFPMSFFAEPYSAEEKALLEAIQMHSLRF